MAEKNDLAVILKQHQVELKSLAPKYISIPRMMAIFIEASRNDKLRHCTQISVLNCCKKMAELGTERVGSGGVHLVPYGNEMTVIPDWRLMVDKARRAGVIKSAIAKAVHEGDIFEYEFGSNKKLVHKPVKKKGAAMSDVYCIYTLPDGDIDFDVMAKFEVDDIRERSKASKSGPWVTDYEEMAKKTVVRRALKIFEGASPELSKVFDTDNKAVGLDEMELQEPIAEPQAIDTPAATLPPEDPEESQGGQPEGQDDPEKVKQEQIFNWCLEMAGGKPDEAEKKVIAFTSFTITDKKTKEKKDVPGVANPYDLHGKRLDVTLDRVQKAYYAWKEGQK
jgi:recombination protein RecT